MDIFAPAAAMHGGSQGFQGPPASAAINVPQMQSQAQVSNRQQQMQMHMNQPGPQPRLSSPRALIRAIHSGPRTI